MDIPLKTKPSALCAKKHPILCGRTSLARGLCVSQPVDCRKRTRSLRSVPAPNIQNIRGAAFGYTENDLGSSCYFSGDTLKLDYHIEYDDGEPVPDTFSCVTYNIWGLAMKPTLQTLFSKRHDILEKTIRDTNADIICLQEMSAFAYTKLKGFIATFPFASEVPYTAGEAERNRAVDVYLLSKYKPSAISIYGLKGVLEYENSLMVVEYPNLVIFNLYNQAGSRHSPGQEHKWIHYSRCRYDILNTIYDMFMTRYKNKACILCGDFNFDLNESVREWPEMDMINKFKQSGFVDTFRKVHPDAKKYPGYTEDTRVNFMRYNQKLIEKRVRYDAILYKPASAHSFIKSSALIGKESACLNVADSKWFIDTIAGSKRPEDLRGCIGSPARMSIHPSDHFGVLTKFGVNVGGGRRTRKRRSNS
jgi:exonuclease III